MCAVHFIVAAKINHTHKSINVAISFVTNTPDWIMDEKCAALHVRLDMDQMIKFHSFFTEFTQPCHVFDRNVSYGHVNFILTLADYC